MSRLDELIRELCPDGVAYKSVQEVCLAISSGGTPNSKNRNYYNGNIPWLRTQEVDFSSITKTGMFITEEGLNNSSAKWIPVHCVILAMYGATVGKVAYNEIPLTTNQACCNLQIDDEIACYKYVYYCLANQYEYIKSLGQGSQTNINAKIVKALRIPVPPLEVQWEIVRILDTFTELTAELSAELTARKKQFEYYRDELLSFDNTVTKCSLSEIADVFRGEYITKKNAKSGNVPVILGGQEPAYYIDKANHEGEIVVVARSGASAGFVSYWNEPIYITDGFGYEAKRNVAIPKYLYYALKQIEPNLNEMKRGAGVPHVSREMLGKVELYVPNIDVQMRLVSVLDNFESICNDLNIGLPAEIEARQKQYEYYRDMLLTFPEAGSRIMTDRQTDRQTELD